MPSISSVGSGIDKGMALMTTASGASDVNCKFLLTSLLRANVGVVDSSGLDSLFSFEGENEKIVCEDPFRPMGLVGIP